MVSTRFHYVVLKRWNNQKKWYVAAECITATFNYSENGVLLQTVISTVSNLSNRKSDIVTALFDSVTPKFHFDRIGEKIKLAYYLVRKCYIKSLVNPNVL